jgi:hypothetical protein
MMIALVFVARIKWFIYKNSQINSTNLMIVLVVYLISFLVKTIYVFKIEEIEEYIIDS